LRYASAACLALAVILLATSPALADPPRLQCWDCLQKLALQLPAQNPQQDPTYEQGLTPGSVLPALSQCSLDDGEIPDLKRIIQVFTDPQVSPSDRAKLVDGARKDLDTTLRHLVDHNCRLLLQSHFDEGASRDWLLRMINLGRVDEER
jgi:hypothetical protein